MNTATDIPTAASATPTRARPPSRTSRILIRAALLLGATGLSAAVIHQGVSNWLASARPAQAADLARGNGRIAVAAARDEVEGGRSVSDPQLRALVHTALSRDPTLTAAIEYRAVDAEQAGDPGKAARLFHFSDAISRRSLPTRLWLIQDAVNRGDVAGALDQFDTALRTSARAPDVLFPVLAGATSDPSLAAPIARVLDRRTEWRGLFLHYAITQGKAAHDLARVVVLMRDRPMIVASGALDSLVGQLVAEGDFSLARAVYDHFHAGERDTGLVRDARFGNADAAFPFGWGLADKGKAGVMRSLAGERTVLAYQAMPGGDGQVASQLLTLSPGRYRLTVTEAEAAADPESPAYWTITCGEHEGAQIALLDQPVRRGAAASVDFVVPAGCTGQWIALTLRLSDAPQGQRGSIAGVTVFPL